MSHLVGLRGFEHAKIIIPPFLTALPSTPKTLSTLLALFRCLSGKYFLSCWLHLYLCGNDRYLTENVNFQPELLHQPLDSYTPCFYWMYNYLHLNIAILNLWSPLSSNSHLLSHLMWTLCYSSFGPKNLGVPFHHLFPSHLLPVIRQSYSVDFNISLESVPFLLWLQLLSWQIWKSFLAWTIALGNKHCNRISCFSFHLSRAILNKDVKLS